MVLSRTLLTHRAEITKISILGCLLTGHLTRSDRRTRVTTQIAMTTPSAAHPDARLLTMGHGVDRTMGLTLRLGDLVSSVLLALLTIHGTLLWNLHTDVD